MTEKRHKKPAVEISAIISSFGLLRDTMARLMLNYEDLSVRQALLHSYADIFILDKGLSKDELIGKRHKQDIVDNRHLIMWHLRDIGFTATEISKYFKRTIHTVGYAIRKQDYLIRVEQEAEQAQGVEIAGVSHENVQ
jgi:hypothetical protein